MLTLNYIERTLAEYITQYQLVFEQFLF